ncbi:MAG: TolC family protein, partial [Bacteroidales bacterium]|nr:TolC family protein [Bacteroidales bacterium]
MRRIFIPIIAATCILPLQMNAQQVLTLEECRQMAIESNKDLDQARTKVEMAGYDRKIARANYFPEISATGAYLYNNRNLSLVTDSQSAMLTNMGTSAQGALDQAVGTISGKVNGAVTQLSTAIMSDPRLAAEYMNSPMWQTVLNMLKESGSGSATAPDIATPINAIGQDIDKSMHLDIENVFIGAVTLKQPVFVGGKIVLSNQIAKMAEELARAEYDMKYADVLVDIDQAYWQIVSIANKKKLAESYSDLLHQLEKDVAVSVQEGVATKSDELQIKVKANEADMMLTKATNGLELAK